jgi:hypothetical protein
VRAVGLPRDLYEAMIASVDYASHGPTWRCSAYLMICCPHYTHRQLRERAVDGRSWLRRQAPLNSQWLIRGWRAPCGLQIFNLQYVCTAAGLIRCDDGEYRDQTKAEEKDFPAQ